MPFRAGPSPECPKSGVPGLFFGRDAWRRSRVIAAGSLGRPGDGFGVADLLGASAFFGYWLGLLRGRLIPRDA